MMMGCSKKLSTVTWLLLPLLFFALQLCTANDRINRSQYISDGQTLVSDGERFVLGFFSPATTHHRYLGIWFNTNKTTSIQTVVWVANREIPLTDSSGVLKIANDGNLVILSGNGSSIWSTKASTAVTNSSTVKLLDSGNLVLTDDSSEVVRWQSFDQPSDTLLPGMKIAMSRKTGMTQFLTSWQSPENPASGKFSVGVDNQGLAQLVLWEGSKKRWRSGPWNAGTFTGIPDMVNFYLNGFTFNSDNKGGMYFTFSLSPDSSDITKFVIDSSGVINQTDWIEGDNDWTVSWSQPITLCEIYGQCGPNGYCNQNGSRICNCLPGFIPKSPHDWVHGKWLDGCFRRIELGCGKNSSDSVRNREGDGFLKLTGMKLPDESDWAAVVDPKGCEDVCIKNCSCVAYAFENGIGCMISVGDLIDLQQFSSGGKDLYLRLAASEIGEKRNFLVIVLATTLCGGIIIGLGAYFVWWWKAKRAFPKAELQGKEKSDQALLFNVGASIDEANENGNRKEKPTDLPLFDLSVIVAATNNFSKENKLGEGGFGPVYKGIIPDGQQIAIKRLSRSSSQGLEEFKNEIILISKLQHRNLVRLLGCCIQGEEKLLIYEYMPNKSLDALLFDPVRGAQLDWRKRFHIIEGIARGLLYLHRDSRLRIIHRDLKASNILLDDQMNPKISDFGMARIFGGNQTQENTKRVVGTIGYMSPEYAMEGQFSEKSDVFSFGVLLLEILTGSRNTSFYHPELCLNLLGFAWHLWIQEKGLDLVDPLLAHSFNKGEVLKCIQVALLCVQDGASNRPTMSYVVSMLDSEATTLATPKQPTFIVERHPIQTNLPAHNAKTHSAADLTLTVVEGR